MDQPLYYYKNLFDHINQGFCIIELKFGPDGKAMDYRYLETNQAFEQQTGLKNVAGKLGSEVIPDLENYWLTYFKEILRSPEPLHAENYNQATRRWHTISSFRATSDGRPIIGALFNDITERKQNEARQKVLLHISDSLSLADDLKTVQTTVTDSLHQYFGAGWCYYVEWDEEKKAGVVLHDSKRDDLPSLAGIHDVSDVPEFLDLLRSGQILNVSDYEDYDLLSPGIRERYTAAGFHSMLVASLVRQGKLISSLIIGDTEIRKWSAADETLLTEVAGRTWAAVERAKAEEALRQSEEKYRTLFETIDEGYLIHEMIRDESGKATDFRLIEVNPAFTRQTGLGQETVGKRASEFLPNLEDFWIETFDRVARSGKPERMENYNQATTRWYDVHISAVGGQGHQVAVLFDDITERKQQEKQKYQAEAEYRSRLEEEVRERTEDLSDSQRLLKTIIDSSFTHIQVFEAQRDDQGAIVDFKWRMVNKGFADKYGDMTGRTLLAQNPAVIETGIFEGMKKATETGQQVIQEHHYQYEQFDGWFFQILTKLDDGLVMTTADITDRKRQEIELQESRDRLQSILDTTLVQMSILEAVRDDQDRITDLEIKAVNQELEKETGRTDLVGKRYATEYPGIRSTGLFDLIIKAIETGEPQSTEYFYPHEGFNKWFTCMFVKLGDGVVASNMDISDRKLAEQRLRETEEAQQLEIFRVILRTQEEERRRISESLHNSLGQMLYGIKMSLTQLKAAKAAANPEQYEMDREYTSHLLSDAIRDSRRISHELMPQVLEEFGLEAAIDEVCKQMQDGVKFECIVELNNTEPDKYMQLAVFRTFQELMTNVVKHAQATRAEATVRDNNGHILIRVSDNGRGIAPEKMGKDGIGLATIRSKVDLLNGTFELESAPGSGTTVTIQLPYIY